MWPREHYYYDCQRETTLEDLKKKVIKITEVIESISDCGLSTETETLVIKELQEKKAKLVELMHQKIDEL